MNREQLFLVVPDEWIHFSFYIWWLKQVHFPERATENSREWTNFRNTHLCGIQTRYVFLVHVYLRGLGSDGGGAWYPSVWHVMLCRLLNSYRRPAGYWGWSSHTTALLWKWAHWRSAIRRNVGQYFPVDTTWPPRRRGSPVLLALDSFL